MNRKQNMIKSKSLISYLLILVICAMCLVVGCGESSDEGKSTDNKVGEEVTAKVVDFNDEDKKISLSIKAMFAPEPKEEAAEEESDEDVVSVDIEAVIASEQEEATEE